MNPYDKPVFQNPFDQAIAWLFVAVWIIVGLVRAKRRFSDATGSEAYFFAAARALFILCFVIGVNLLIGIIFLAWLKISSVFWVIWELLWMMSVIVVFEVIPIFSTLLLGLALVGKRKWNHSRRALIMTAKAFLIFGVDVLLNYIFMRCTQN